jgi:endoglucanase Acf2
MTAIQEYWFDVHDTNHPASYTPSVVTMIWGGKGANGTWFSGKPEMIHGINWLPIHGGSLYLGHYPDYALKNYAALRAETNNRPWSDWSDLIWMYRALSDADDALRQFTDGRDRLPKEAGNSLPNTYAWIGALHELGRVQREVTANSPLAAVFDKGNVRTYVAYGQKPRETVKFSDGFELLAKQRGLARGTREK